MSRFKVGQVWVTRDGRKARIVATDRKDNYCPVVALVADKDADEWPETYADDGYCLMNKDEHGADLIREHREPREVWVMFSERGNIEACGFVQYSGGVKFREVIE